MPMRRIKIFDRCQNQAGIFDFAIFVSAVVVLVYTFLGGLCGALISIVIVTGLGFVKLEGNDVLEFLGHPTLSWPIGFATILILGLCGLAAGYFPARRAAAIDPASTLRYE